MEHWDGLSKVEHDSGQVTITLDEGPSLTTELKELRHIEYGYVTTSHSSQGMTIDQESCPCTRRAPQ
jgi:ATP-dependent exoDNAse (exonuclease V) alpha subunit